MRLVAGFDFMNGTGHLGEQGGILFIIPVGEVSGETFYTGELVVLVRRVIDTVIESIGSTVRADEIDALRLA